MKRYKEEVKELYEQVGELEYNMINPYAQAKLRILTKYPKAKITRFKTEYIYLYDAPNQYRLAPYLCIWFDTQEEVQCVS